MLSRYLKRRLKSLFTYSKKKLIISIVLLVFSMILILPLLKNSLKSVSETSLTPDISFGYGLEQLKEIRQIYGEDGAKEYFFSRFTYDVIWMIIYFYFLLNMFAFLLNGLKSKWILLFKSLPFIALCFDFFENVFCSLYFFYGQEIVGVMAATSSLIKWCALILALISFGILYILKTYKRLKK